MIQAPIFHINSDDVDAAYNVLQIALDYRQKFGKDVVIDIIGFRRLGHNEGDEPTYTQPVMYQRIREHPGVRELYARKLIAEGVLTKENVASLMEERMRRYENAQLGAKAIVEKQGTAPHIIPPVPEPERAEVHETGVSLDTLRRIVQTITTVPHSFNLNPKIVGLLSRRAKMVEGQAPTDWGTAEALAFGSILVEGTSVRLTGQDTVRGTFSHRHAVLPSRKSRGFISQPSISVPSKLGKRRFSGLTIFQSSSSSLLNSVSRRIGPVEMLAAHTSCGLAGSLRVNAIISFATDRAPI
jgi:2-oxoglutarate dehydrogenase E1 component